MSVGDVHVGIEVAVLPRKVLKSPKNRTAHRLGGPFGVHGDR